MTIKKTVKKLFLFLFSALITILVTVIPATSQTNPQVTLNVVTDPVFPPFEMKNSQTGEIEGFDIDLIKAIGEEAGYNVQVESLPFDGIITTLQASSADAAISGMTITPERQQTIDFSRPYFKAGLAIAVREDNTSIKNFNDLKNKKVAVQIGTTGAIKAKEIPGAQITQFDAVVLSLQELINGKVDAVVNDIPVTLYAIKNAGLKGVKIAGDVETKEYYGIAFPKNSPHVKTINWILSYLIDNGTYKDIYEKWFGVEPPPLPPPSKNGANLVSKNQEIVSYNWFALFPKLIKGAGVTLLLTSFAVFFGLIGGILVALALISPSKPLRLIFRVYVEFFRGTPMLVQLFIIYFGLPAILKQFGLEQFSLDKFPAAIIALSLNVAAYLAEIIRGGILSIDKGQWEACESLGMSPIQTMQDVIFPQAFRRMLPALGNEFITLIKDTSLVAVIGFVELFREGQLEVSITYRAFEIYVAVALVYLVLTNTASLAFKWLEGFMDPVGRAKAIAEGRK